MGAHLFSNSRALAARRKKCQNIGARPMPDTSKHLLLVEDEAGLRAAMAEHLGDRGYRVEQADSGEAAIARLIDFAFDIVVTDLRLPGVDGCAVIDAAVERYPDIVGIVITGYATVRDAVDAIKRGASDFVTKPFQIEELLHALDKAQEQRRLKSENAYLHAQLEQRYRPSGIIGKSRVMTALVELLETIAATNSTILIRGETGTGKEVVARAIHHASPRRTQRFVALNCSAIPETLLETELFGHVRGAFTGAVGNRQGRMEQAHRGTLFLDEVGTMSAALQAKLLRVLQEREFDRIGDTQPVRVDVRVIAATNSDLAKMVAAGQFREDLYYRLNVIPVWLPPLRDRTEDIPLLAGHFLEKLSAPGRGAVTISQPALRQLMAYNWPGNVRQLENAIERALALLGRRSQIETGDLPPEMQPDPGLPPEAPVALPDEGLNLEDFVHRLERDLIEQSLARTGGNKGHAAKLLRLKRTTLVEKLKRMNRKTGEVPHRIREI
jgi:DNA-binding NtrC family response regulator